ncbi:hypothetical protein EDB80DRAFT_335579 [Ilyonectria destructans]|nr:hypothetical protein EDB80DRAFT_335579 [Ilyonectria destructans]
MSCVALVHLVLNSWGVLLAAVGRYRYLGEYLVAGSLQLTTASSAVFFFLEGCPKNVLVRVLQPSPSNRTAAPQQPGRQGPGTRASATTPNPLTDRPPTSGGAKGRARGCWGPLCWEWMGMSQPLHPNSPTVSIPLRRQILGASFFRETT